MANLREAFQYASQNPNSDFAKNLEQMASSGALNIEAKKYGIDLSPFQTQATKQEQPAEKKGILEEGGAVQQFGTGVAKGALSTAKGLGELTSRGLSNLPGKAGEFFQGGVEESKRIDESGLLQAQGGMEKLGKGIEQIAEFAIPATKVSKLTQGASLVGKIIPRALTSAGVASAQEGEIGKEAAIAAGIETALPIAGKLLTPVKNVVGRLFKGLGSGLSGVGTDTIDQIIKNPKVAQETSKKLIEGGNRDILTQNVKTIINGVSNIKKEARQAYKTGLEVLKQTDIDSKVFRNSTQSVLDKYGSVIKNGERKLTNVEFSDPKNIKMANDLLNKLQTSKLDGKSLRKLADDIESKAYKIATSDERLSFNAFIKDLSNSLKTGISKSTSKLDEINKAFSRDVQLAESIENIFGKVKFKNASEINKVAQQLESLFSKKGLSIDYLDDFFNRIGVSPEGFKTTEAVRQISNKASRGLNAPGLTIGEITQGLTGAVVTPKLVRDIAILTGKTQPFIKNLIEKTAPTARAGVIKGLIEVME